MTPSPSPTRDNIHPSRLKVIAAPASGLDTGDVCVSEPGGATAPASGSALGSSASGIWGDKPKVVVARASVPSRGLEASGFDISGIWGSEPRVVAAPAFGSSFGEKKGAA